MEFGPISKTGPLAKYLAQKIWAFWQKIGPLTDAPKIRPINLILAHWLDTRAPSQFFLNLGLAYNSLQWQFCALDYDAMIGITDTNLFLGVKLPFFKILGLSVTDCVNAWAFYHDFGPLVNIQSLGLHYICFRSFGLVDFAFLMYMFCFFFAKLKVYTSNYYTDQNYILLGLNSIPSTIRPLVPQLL